MNKTQRTLNNTIASLLQLFFVSVLGLMFSKVVLLKNGSELNGLNATLTQMVNSLFLLEGGFTTASNVALFEPFSNGDLRKINTILSNASIRFSRIGNVILFLGIGICFLIPGIINSSFSNTTIIILFFLALLPSFVNIKFGIRYQLVFLAEQKEYFITYINLFTNIISYIVGLLLLMHGTNYLVVRAIFTIVTIIGTFVLFLLFKKKYPQILFYLPDDTLKIKGTTSVFIMKIVSFFYVSLPVILLSTIGKNGLLIVSVYSIYKTIVAMVGSLLTSVANAPRLSFGALLAEGRLKNAQIEFEKYEMIVLIGLAVILGTTCILFMPFVRLYTAGVTDINYEDRILEIILIVTCFFEVSHLPSGQIMVMNGDFDNSKKIQLIALIVLTVCLLLSRIFLWIYGIAISVLVAAIVLWVLEIGYVAKFIFKRKIVRIFRNFLPAIITCVICFYIGEQVQISIINYFEFVKIGFVIFVINTCFTLMLYFVFYGLELISMIKGIIKNL